MAWLLKPSGTRGGCCASHYTARSFSPLPRFGGEGLLSRIKNPRRGKRGWGRGTRGLSAEFYTRVRRGSVRRTRASGTPREFSQRRLARRRMESPEFARTGRTNPGHYHAAGAIARASSVPAPVRYWLRPSGPSLLLQSKCRAIKRKNMSQTSQVAASWTFIIFFSEANAGADRALMAEIVTTAGRMLVKTTKTRRHQ